MKKLIVLIIVLSVVLLCGCNKAPSGDANTTTPNSNASTNKPTENESGNSVGETTKPIDWETPIDIDDSFSEIQPEVTDPAASEPTEPSVSDPFAATEPSATEPTATEPTATEPQPTKPSGYTSKPIELPMIPG